MYQEKTKKKWRFSRSRSLEPAASSSVQETNAETNNAAASTSFSLAAASQSLIPQLEEIKELKLSENDGGQNKHAYSVALASAVAAEAAAVAAQAAAEVVRLTAATNTASAGTSKVAQKSKEDIAAIRIQTAFRGFLVWQPVVFFLSCSCTVISACWRNGG
jgi:cytoskeletal protein RodZ